MKRISFLLILSMLFTLSCVQQEAENKTDSTNDDEMMMLEKNKKAAILYHDLKAENIDLILTEDFIGRAENGHTWDRESHRKFLSNGRFKADVIDVTVAEGDWVTTKFTRTMVVESGDTLSAPAMHFKRFEGDKIAELWEFYDYTETE